MLKKFKNIVDNDPILFTEDVYLCTELGEVLAGRYGIKRRMKNIFELMKSDDVRFIKSYMALPGFRPLILADTREGLVIFDLSLCPKFGLLIVIFPRFGREELLALSSARLLERMTLSDAMKMELEKCNGIALDDTAYSFADRLLAVRRSGEYFAFLKRITFSFCELFPGCVCLILQS